MKKFMMKLLLFFILLALGVIPFNVAVDPYNVFHGDSIRDNGVEPNKNYIKTKFVLSHKEDYDSYLFGSSRAGFIDVSRLPGGSWYNFSYSEGLPKEQYETLQALIAGGEIPKQVYLSIDNISYLDTVTTIEAIPVIKDYTGDTEGLRKRMYSTGCEDLNLNMQFDTSDTKAYWADYYEPRIEEAVEEIKMFKELCDSYDIELTVFTNPLYVSTYERAVDKGYLDFLEEVAHVTPFYNFSGYNEISMNQDYYFETSHYTPEAAAVIMDIIENGSDEHAVRAQGFGYYVTEENLDDFMEIIRHQAYVTGILEYKGE